MTPDQARLLAASTANKATRLTKELPGLGGLARFMMSGAHPDDECAPMMAALHFRDKMALSYACSTRGEGGQNNIGTERGPSLGALRTAEMEAACDVMNMRMYWLSDHPEDPITDWRLSKSGEETLDVWTYDRTLRRMVHILRRDKPDALCPTFLDVPGQHGHHRAMTQIAHDAFAAAADPAFDTGQQPWAVSKLYLPAWSGAGQAYDDEVPPPPATVTVDGSGTEPMSGWSYALIGALSHGHHRSQGMGRWPAEARDFALHLAETRVGADSQAVTDNLVHSFGDIGLPDIDAQIDALIPGPDLTKALLELNACLEKARTAPEHAHRIARTRLQVARLMAIETSNIPATYAPQTSIAQGESIAIDGLPPQAKLRVPKGWSTQDNHICAETAPIDRGYRDTYDPLEPPLPAIEVTARGLQSLWPLSQPLLVRPETTVTLPTRRVLINLAASDPRRTLPLSDDAELDLPSGWHGTHSEGAITLKAPPITGNYRIPVLSNGRPAHTTERISHPHIRETQYCAPAILDASVMEVQLPEAPISYMGAGLDTVAPRLREIGMVVEEPDTLSDLQSVLLVGIHAFRFNPVLAQAGDTLNDWIRGGGHLVTLYHRPWDNWDPETTPPLRLEIGQPSLRWRVTQKDAPVTIDAPNHPVLMQPNKIQNTDFEGWHKERGLYFAASWDPAYTPVFSMSDPGEKPLKGSLLTAHVGHGRHTHIALNLHHQLEHGVEGAVRLLINCLAL